MTERCEMCEQRGGWKGGDVLHAVAYFGWDNTPLCAGHLVEAERNYEAATLAQPPSGETTQEQGEEVDA